MLPWETGPAMHHRPTVSYENILDDGGPSVAAPSPAAESPNGGLFPVARDRAFPFVPEEENKSEGDCVGRQAYHGAPAAGSTGPGARPELIPPHLSRHRDHAQAGYQMRSYQPLRCSGAHV
ncbi:unnamed protein product [Gadus morhua 'NCC']